MITFSAPGKVHLLGEHAVVYGKPALLAAIDLRVYVTVASLSVIASESGGAGERGNLLNRIKEIIEPIVKKHLKIKTIPPYQVIISSQLPLGAGLGSSAAISAPYIASLLSFLKAKWDLNLINNLSHEVEKIFHGNPSGADNSTVIFGGLIWFRKETKDVKLIYQLPFSISSKLAKNFLLINTGIPKENTAEMVKQVQNLSQRKPKLVKKFLEDQENLVKELPSILQKSDQKGLISVINAGERNLETLGVVSKKVVSIIRIINRNGGAAKICGGGGKKGPTGILLCYHPTPSKLVQIAKLYNLEYFRVALGVQGLKEEQTK